jgi:hypothetical protein
VSFSKCSWCSSIHVLGFTTNRQSHVQLSEIVHDRAAIVLARGSGRSSPCSLFLVLFCTSRRSNTIGVCTAPNRDSLHVVSQLHTSTTTATLQSGCNAAGISSARRTNPVNMFTPVLRCFHLRNLKLLSKISASSRAVGKLKPVRSRQYRPALHSTPL